MMTAEPWYYVANKMMFSTADSDNDVWFHGSCALLGGGSTWWFGGCSTSNNNLDGDCFWLMGEPVIEDVQASRIMIKLI